MPNQSQMVEFQQKAFGQMQGILITRHLVALPPKVMSQFVENLEQKANAYALARRGQA